MLSMLQLHCELRNTHNPLQESTLRIRSNSKLANNWTDSCRLSILTASSSCRYGSGFFHLLRVSESSPDHSYVSYANMPVFYPSGGMPFKHSLRRVCQLAANSSDSSDGRATSPGKAREQQCTVSSLKRKPRLLRHNCLETSQIRSGF